MTIVYLSEHSKIKNSIIKDGILEVEFGKKFVEFRRREDDKPINDNVDIGRLLLEREKFIDVVRNGLEFGQMVSLYLLQVADSLSAALEVDDDILAVDMINKTIDQLQYGGKEWGKYFKIAIDSFEKTT